MSQIQIPKDWIVNSLEKICLDIQPGFAEGQKDVPNGIIHLRMNNINTAFKLNFDLIRTIKPTSEQIDKYKLEKNDIVFNNTNSTTLVGKSALFEDDNVCLYSNHLTRLRINDKLVLPKWVLLYLQYLWHQRYFERNCNKWINQAAFNNEKIKKLEIPVPSIETQKKIIQKLDYLLEQLEEKKKEILKLQKTKLKHFELLSENFMSYLIAELIPTDNYPSCWEPTILGNIIEEIKNKWQPNSESENLNYIGLENIESNTGKLVDFTPTNSLEIKSTKTYFTNNHVLYGKLRPYLNKVLLPTFNGVCSTDILVLQPKDNILREFLAYFLRSSHVLSKMTNLMYGTKMPRAKIQDLQQIKIGLPPKKEQKALIKKLQESEKYVDSVKQSITTATKQQEKLIKYLEYLQTSILDKAFSGKLVN